jgi:hypothetical protein
MMCNPNITPNGAKQTGSPTGKQCLGINPAHLELFEKTAQHLSRRIATARNSWLRCQLLKLDMPFDMLAGVEAGDAGWKRLAAKWIYLHGLTWKAELLNTIELFQFGESIAFAKLFDMPPYEDKTAESY